MKPIFIETHGGELFTVMVRMEWTVVRIKNKIRDVIGKPRWQQVLKFMGQVLDDSKTLNCYGITEDACLQFELPLDQASGASSSAHA